MHREPHPHPYPYPYPPSHSPTPSYTTGKIQYATVPITARPPPPPQRKEIPPYARRAMWARILFPECFVNACTICCDFVPRCMDCLMTLLGPILVVFVWCLLAAIIYIYFAHLLPLRQWPTFSYPSIPITPLGLFIVFNLYYHHIKAVFLGPGRVPAHITVPPEIQQLIDKQLPSLPKGHGFAKYCRTCKRPKPPRTHHCHVCNNCGLKMDHHCPWIANCVGYHNYRHFCLFLLYLEVGCLYLVILCAPPIFFQNVPEELEHHEPSIFFLFILTAAAFMAVGVLTALHAYLVLTNQSTIEMYYNQSMKSKAEARGQTFHNPYDLGWRKNHATVFGVGRYWFSWFIPPLPKLDGDGISFPTRDGGEHTGLNWQEDIRDDEKDDAV